MNRIGLVAFSLLFALPVQAQQPTTPPVVEFNLRVTGPELDLIGKGLGTQPFNDVAPLMQKLRQQVVEQQQPAKPQVTTPDPDKPK